MVNVFWFRRDLRLHDNHALSLALSDNKPVLPIFIFDSNILYSLPGNDARINFIYKTLNSINGKLNKIGSSLMIFKGQPVDIWKNLCKSYSINKVFINTDYEPYSLNRDQSISSFLKKNGIDLFSVKDQVIFEKDEVVKDNNEPYTVFTPFSRKWKKNLEKTQIPSFKIKSDNFIKEKHRFPEITEINFTNSRIKISKYNPVNILDYDKYRDFPALEHTTNIGPHLRFGTVSIRETVNTALHLNTTFLNELIWREFFMQILFHFPKVITNNFKSQYDNIKWINNPDDFIKWKIGKTGYPIVDAGMRQLNQTGIMHNRIRMITASFLCKHLLTDWRLGEAYFAEKLLDYELASNNGNWQWAAGTGCDAAPYFRVFNPEMQQKKFDKNMDYIKKWIPEFGTSKYVKPIIDHKFARNRAIETYKTALNSI